MSLSEAIKSTSTNGDSSTEAFQIVEVDGNDVHLHNFHLANADVADYLRKLPEEERAIAIIKALEVGIFCLDRVSSSKDTEFWKRQIDKLLSETQNSVNNIPKKLEDELLKRIGTENGQVLNPIVNATDRAVRTVNEKVQEVRDLFGRELDCSKDTSTLGKSIRQLRDLLDPGRTDSVQGKLSSAIEGASAQDGNIAKSVRAVVTDTIRPLVEEVNRLAKEIHGQKSAEDALLNTTEKGTPFEDEVVLKLRQWATPIGAEIEHTGPDNKPGDMVVKFPSTSLACPSLCLVIEARDRSTSKGRKAISDDLGRKMSERSANAAIYLSRGLAGLGKELGSWSEGETQHGPWVATTFEYLEIALRFICVLAKLRAVHVSNATLDSSAVKGQLQLIRTSLGKVTTINTKVTNIQQCAEDVRSHANELRNEIQGAIMSLEDTLRQSTVDCESK